jgi:hypothetical protein
MYEILGVALIYVSLSNTIRQTQVSLSILHNIV